MADRHSAALFEQVFFYLADTRTKKSLKPDKTLLTIWYLANEYDFSPDQMGCDDSLVKLGLAKEVREPGPYGDETVVVYRNPDGSWPKEEN